MNQGTSLRKRYVRIKCVDKIGVASRITSGIGTRLHGGYGWSPKETNESKYRLGDGIASVETGNVLKTRLDRHS